MSVIEMTKTLRVRVRDKHAKFLSALAVDVNTVWNYCNEVSSRSIRERRRPLSGYDLNNLTSGYTKCEGVLIGAATIQRVGETYASNRKQSGKDILRWRVSNLASSRRSLGWVPFRGESIKPVSGGVRFSGRVISVWDSYGLGRYIVGSGSFSEDSLGRWFLSATIKIVANQSSRPNEVGIDLGLKEVAVCSSGDRLHSRPYRELELELSSANRARKRRMAKAINARIANKRRDALHKFSTSLVSRHGFICVGNVSPSAMARSRFAKSSLDCGWAMLKTMLEYKSQMAGVVFIEVNEANSTQTCSSCGDLPDSRPRGIAGLGIREWICSSCGALHDRDINAAKNILARGHARLAEGATALPAVSMPMSGET